MIKPLYVLKLISLLVLGGDCHLIYTYHQYKNGHQQRASETVMSPHHTLVYNNPVAGGYLCGGGSMTLKSFVLTYMCVQRNITASSQYVFKVVLQLETPAWIKHLSIIFSPSLLITLLVTHTSHICCRQASSAHRGACSRSVWCCSSPVFPCCVALTPPSSKGVRLGLRAPISPKTPTQEFQLSQIADLQCLII